MQSMYSASDELVGGFSTDPMLPNVVSLDLAEPLNNLTMYTNNLQEFAAPHELCVQKALELISKRSNYGLNLEAFRMELLDQVLVDSGSTEVNALVAGIKCICDYLLASFDKVTKFNADLFPYEFYRLVSGRYLFLSKIVIDANLPPIRPAVIAQPAYTYPEVQAGHRAHYFTQTDQCLVL
ncbi:hypothetical protein [Ralstonia phage RP12]|uniref:Uncharacterized protein n=1 Tax=Ralstonia phage RP12 TaxID=1923889 RepID=A0A1L7N0I7_9CAUD|nr:hypothetical protein FDH28_gp008 [Ralstonia phage RP12]BAW18982.1 hypothetical protein [Ralstonia phage RP12]